MNVGAFAFIVGSRLEPAAAGRHGFSSGPAFLAERYAVLPAGGGFEIHPVEDLPDAVELHGLHGFKAPTYQRVDALTVPFVMAVALLAWTAGASTNAPETLST